MTRNLGTASPGRCALVWLSATAVAILLAATLLPDLLAAFRASSATFESLLVAWCEAALVLTAAWAWLATGAVTLDAVRGRTTERRGVPAGWRRLVLVACGVALAGSLATPSYASPSYADPVRPTADRPRPTALVRGLPLPDRASAVMHVAHLVAAEAEQGRDRSRTETRAPAPRTRTVVVSAGDTLWALAAATLPPGACEADVAARVTALHRTNRDVVGADPDLILPGQELRLPWPSSD